MKACLACILVVSCVGCATDPMRECERSLTPINAPVAAKADSDDERSSNSAKPDGD